MKRVFLSGPYSAPTEVEVMRNIRVAEEVSIAVRQMGEGGAAVFCPHKNSANLGGVMPYEFWIQECLAFLAVCDCVVMLPGWENSEGAKVELAAAQELEKRVFYWHVPMTEENDDEKAGQLQLRKYLLHGKYPPYFPMKYRIKCP
jgi:hypothetical protein